MCNSNVVEDELHFLFMCERYNDLRYTLYQKISKYYSDFKSLTLYEKLHLLSEQPIILGNFIQKAFSKRQALLYE